MKRGSLIVALVAVLGGAGCISNTKYGNDIQEAVGTGGSESDVIAKHGAPDNIVYLGTQYYNPQTGERGLIDKYLLEYRIGGGSTFMGKVYAGDKFASICYLIEKGRVQGGAWSPEGSGTIVLYGDFVHPRARAGYGGDGTPSSPPRSGIFGLGFLIF